MFSQTKYVQIYQHLALVPGEPCDGPDDRGHQLPESINAEEDRATSSCYKQSKRKVLLDQITTKLFQVAFSNLFVFFLHKFLSPGFLDDSSQKLLSLTIQEQGLVNRDPAYVNPYRQEKKRQKKKRTKENEKDVNIVLIK